MRRKAEMTNVRVRCRRCGYTWTEVRPLTRYVRGAISTGLPVPGQCSHAACRYRDETRQRTFDDLLNGRAGA